MRRASIVLALCVLLGLGTPAVAANHYVRSGAGGTGAGTDWTNACTGFTGSCAVGSLVRGDTYFVATGTYAAVTFNTATSGSLVITIKGATVATHGSSTGWQATFSVDKNDGGAQATWSYGPTQIQTDHWVFDGAVGPGFTGSIGSGNDSTAYGFRFANPSCGTDPTKYLTVSNNGTAQTDVTVKHLAVVACGSSFNTLQQPIGAGCGNCYLTNLTVSYTYMSQANIGLNMTNVSSSTFEHNYWENFQRGSSNNSQQGKEAVGITNCQQADNGSCTTLCTQGSCAVSNVFRYNLVRSVNPPSFTGGIVGLGGGNTAAFKLWDIYGNVFVDCGGNSGCLAGPNVFEIVSVNLYNNTFINVTKFFVQCETCSVAGGNVIENNLFYNSDSRMTQGSGGGAITHDYNTYWNPTDAGQTETHGQIVNGGACPLGNCAIDGTGVYTLLVDGGASCASTTVTCTGLTLAAPYATDVAGHTRAADGTWERGAYEFVAGAPPPPSTPLFLRLIEDLSGLGRGGPFFGNPLQ